MVFSTHTQKQFELSAFCSDARAEECLSICQRARQVLHSRPNTKLSSPRQADFLLATARRRDVSAACQRPGGAVALASCFSSRFFGGQHGASCSSCVGWAPVPQSTSRPARSCSSSTLSLVSHNTGAPSVAAWSGWQRKRIQLAAAAAAC